MRRSFTPDEARLFEKLYNEGYSFTAIAIVMDWPNAKETSGDSKWIGWGNGRRLRLGIPTRKQRPTYVVVNGLIKKKFLTPDERQERRITKIKKAIAYHRSMIRKAEDLIADATLSKA